MGTVIQLLVSPLMSRNDKPQAPQAPPRPQDGPRVQSVMNAQFFVGPAGSGAPFHFHNNALNTLAWGMKRWYLAPPAVTPFSQVRACVRALF